MIVRIVLEVRERGRGRRGEAKGRVAAACGRRRGRVPEALVPPALGRREVRRPRRVCLAERREESFIGSLLIATSETTW